MRQSATGAMLRGGQLGQAGAPVPPQGGAGLTGANLAGPPPGQDADQGPGADQGQGGGGQLDQALMQIIQAAQQAGFQLPTGNVPQDQLPQVYQQLLQAASQSPMGQSPDGRAMIAEVAQALGLPPPGGGQDQGQQQQQPPPDQGSPPPAAAGGGY